MSIIRRIFEHPLTRGLSVDDPRTTLLRRKIIQDKAFLRSLYVEWYNVIIGMLPNKNRVLELGSGAGFLKKFLPNVITSEIMETSGVDLIADACDLPFRVGALEAIVMTDVFHHIPDVKRFFDEASRCIRPGGKIVMIEPWCNWWSKRVYMHLHSEPFDTDGDWSIPKSGPLSGANGALPWIIFQRDRELFEQRYPQWCIKSIRSIMPFSYILSGGVSMRSLIPGFMYQPVRLLERILRQEHWGMFAVIELDKEMIVD